MRQTTATTIVWLALLFTAHVAQPSQSACFGPGHNKRDPSEVLPAFDALVQEHYVGQNSAVQAVRRELVDFVLSPRGDEVGGDEPGLHDKPLVLHFIGPAGTGKSYLAELVAKSVFKPVDCTPQHAGMRASIGSALASGLTAAVFVANPAVAAAGALFGFGFGTASQHVLERTCMDGANLRDWSAMCGVFRRAFNPFVSDEQLQTLMTSMLGDAAREVEHHPQAVLIMDDFQFCAARGCELLLKEPLTSFQLYTRDTGKPVSLRDCIIILTSDLSTIGLELEPGLSSEDALVQVQQAAEAHWGKNSLIMSEPVVVAFSPLSHKQLVRIVHKIIGKFRTQLHRRIQRAFKERGRLEGHEVQWAGAFFCGEDTKEAIVDQLHEQVRIKNARALTLDLANILQMAAKRPIAIEDRIVAAASNPKERVFRASVELIVDTNAQTQSGDSWLKLRLV